MVTFHVGLLQGQTRIAKLKSAYNLLTPPSRLSNGCLALVSFLFGEYNLHRFSDALGLVVIEIESF